MSDRSPVTLNVHDALPEAYARAVASVFDNHTGYDYADDKTITELTQLGATWLNADDISLGTAKGIADDLMALVTGGAATKLAPLRFGFTVWQEPKYEYPGSLYRCFPGEALFAANCDADGNVTVVADEVRAAITTTGGRDDLIAALSALFGEPLH